MQAQGTSLVNTSYFTTLTNRINNISVCSELQAAANEAMADLQAQVSGIESEIASLLPMIKPPTDLGSCISFCTNLSVPYLKAYNNAMAQMTQVLEAISSLAAAIENAASRLESCIVNVPAVTAN